MQRFQLSLAHRFYDMGSVRLAPNELLGTIELEDGIDPERVRRAMSEDLLLMDKMGDRAPQQAKPKGKKHKMQVTNGRNS